MKPAIHQMVAGFTSGDAISNHARSLREIFLRWGHASKVYAIRQHIMSSLLGEALAAKFLQPAPEDVVILHLSIGDPVNHLFRELACRKVVIYHNITPAHYFEGLSPGIARVLARGREDLALLAGTPELALGVSRYNADELVAAGYGNVDVLPLVLDLARLDGGRRDPGYEKLFGQDGKTNICFVGRVAPNKCIEDLVSAFYYYHRYINPQSRFLHVGNYHACLLYKRILETRLRELDFEAFHFLGGVTEEQLRTVFQLSDVFVCMSEHEGFCIPLLEAMQAGLPVLAYAAAAIPETLDGAGVLVKEKSWPHVAGMIDALARPGDFREGILAGQAARLQRYRELELESALREKLAPLLAVG